MWLKGYFVFIQSQLAFVPTEYHVVKLDTHTIAWIVKLTKGFLKFPGSQKEETLVDANDGMSSFPPTPHPQLFSITLDSLYFPA